MRRAILFLLAAILTSLAAAIPISSPAPAGVHDPRDVPEVRACLRQIRAFPDSLAPRLRLIEVCRGLGTVEGRRLAARQYAELLRRRPRDVSLLLPCARLRMDQGYLSQAERLFKKVVALDPGSVPAHFGMAQLALQDYRRYLDKKRLRTATSRLERVLALDPDHHDALFYRAFTSMVDGDSSRTRSFVERLVARYPDDPWGWLFKGTLAQESRRYGEARSALETASRLLADPAEKEAFETLRYLNRRTEAVRETSGVAARSRLSLDFWKRADPTPATGTNERRLEHLSRMVLADLLYAVPQKRIRGWDTAAGEAIIRFGPPVSREIGVGEESVAGFAPPAMIHVHEIDGEDVMMTFLDRNLSGRWLQPYNMGFPTNMDLETSRSESYYEYPVDGPRLNLLMQKAQFREGDRTRLELVFATVDSGGPAGRLAREVTLYDSSWDSLTAARGWTAPPVRVASRRQPGVDLAVDLVALAVPPGPDSLWIGAQVRDTLSHGYGSRFDRVALRQFPNSRVAVSDILLLDRIGFEAGPEQLSRGGGWGVPSPDRTYREGENVPFYFEAYNLVPDSSGLVRYSVRITIDPRRKARSLISRAALISFRAPIRPRVETRFDEAAPAGDVRRMLDLEVGSLSPDTYRLTVTVTDQVGGGADTASVSFTVVKRR